MEGSIQRIEPRFKTEVGHNFRPGMKCMVLNYRRKGCPPEAGFIESAEVGIRPDGTFRLKYTVLLDRRTKNSRRVDGSALRLYVGEDQVYSLDRPFRLGWIEGRYIIIQN